MTLSPTLERLRTWKVCYRDDGGDRFVIGRGGRYRLVDQDGTLHPVGDYGSLLTKGGWTDEDLPTIEAVLGRVRTTL